MGRPRGATAYRRAWTAHGEAGRKVKEWRRQQEKGEGNRRKAGSEEEEDVERETAENGRDGPGREEVKMRLRGKGRPRGKVAPAAKTGEGTKRGQGKGTRDEGTRKRENKLKP